MSFRLILRPVSTASERKTSLGGSVEDFILVQTLEPVKTGQVFERLPIHMTTLPWFSMSRDLLRDFALILTELAAQHGKESSDAIGQERVMFGPNNEVPACTMNIASQAIHDGALEWVTRYGGTFKREQFVQDYQAHISDEAGVSIQPGQKVAFLSLALFSYQDMATEKRKVVEHSVQLGGVA